jgi:inorganic pyrophosphatase
MMNNTYSRWRPHPWHGLHPGPKAPSILDVFIEITQYDLVKYELDKGSGFLRVDRTQLTSSLPPSLYGFIPQTYSGSRVAGLMPGVEEGDGDPMDICVICERPVARAGVIVTATVVGGLPMIDDGFADDKIIAILQNDPVLGHIQELEEVPDIYISRLRHYFSTYKLLSRKGKKVEVGKPYNRAHAEAVIQASLDDYRDLIKTLSPV